MKNDYVNSEKLIVVNQSAKKNIIKKISNLIEDSI